MVRNVDDSKMQSNADTERLSELVVSHFVRRDFIPGIDDPLICLSCDRLEGACGRRNPSVFERLLSVEFVSSKVLVIAKFVLMKLHKLSDCRILLL